MDEPRRILIVGGVAGGASCAARLRRLSETAHIQVFDRVPHVSFAKCGLPYYVGDVIHNEQDLLVATPELFTDRFAIDIHCRTEVVAIDRHRKVATVRNLETGLERDEPYDALVLATGAAAIRPDLPGIDHPGIFAVRTIPDSQRLRGWLEDKSARHAVVVGGGFIGLEMTENLIRRGVSVTLIERLPHLMPALDAEMATPLHCRLREEGVDLRLQASVTSFEADGDRVIVHTESPNQSGTDQADTDHITADLVVLGIGVRPETALARSCGLELGELGGLRVDEQLRTNDASIWAVGDVVENHHIVTGRWCLMPLAGPANRQGRVAADSIFGRPTKFRGVQGTSVCGLFGMTVATTGANEGMLQACDMPYQKIYLHPGHHVGYYPGSRPIDLKLLFAPDGRLLGAQAVGWEGVDKRIDVIATALKAGLTVYDLEEVELCYAPQFGAAKDPVNIAAMIAANALRDDAPVRFWNEPLDDVLLDVRDPDEFEAGHVPGAINIPLHQLRERLQELPQTQSVSVYCLVGQRAYYATRLLRLNGVDARNMTGGYKTFLQFQETCAE